MLYEEKTREEYFEENVLAGNIRIFDIPEDIRQSSSVYIYAIRHVMDSVFSAYCLEDSKKAYTEYAIIEKYLLDDIIKTNSEWLTSIHREHFSEWGYADIFHNKEVERIKNSRSSDSGSVESQPKPKRKKRGFGGKHGGH